MPLSGNTPAGTYQSLLTVAGGTGALTSSLQTVKDGAGNSSILQLSTSAAALLGTLTFADGATWGTTGINASAAAYSTSSTAAVNWDFTWTWSSTGNGIKAIDISPTMVPAGASAGNTQLVQFGPGVGGSSSANIAEFRTLNISVNTNAGYTGTLASGRAILIGSPSAGGTNPMTAYTGLIQAAVANGNGITSGTVTNIGVDVAAFTAAAGAGGTVVNTGIRVTLPSSSSAGNTDKAIYITGNGGALSTKYALYSDSTAQSVLSGLVAIPAASGLTAAGSSRTDALALTGQVNNVTTAAASTGVILPAGVVGNVITIFNAGANAMKVYAPGSDSIDGTAGSSGVTLTNGKRCQYFCVATNNYQSAQMGVVSA